MFRWPLMGLLVTTVLALGLPDSRAAWGNGNCSTVGGALPTFGIVPGPTPELDKWAKDTGHEWVRYYSDVTVHYLYKNRKQIGSYDGQYYRTYFEYSRTYGEPMSGPWEPVTGPKSRTNFGVEVEKIKGSPDYSKNGKKCSRQEALSAIEDDLPDDSGLYVVVATGDETFHKKVADDWEKAKDLHQFALLHCYSPDFWWVQDNQLPANSVLVCSPDGKALHLQKGYNEGDCRLFAGVFDPKAVPDVRADPLAGLWNGLLTWIRANQMLAAGIAAVGAYFWWNRSKK